MEASGPTALYVLLIALYGMVGLLVRKVMELLSIGFLFVFIFLALLYSVVAFRLSELFRPSELDR